MESKHTKTPWTRRDFEIDGAYGTNWIICDCMGATDNDDENLANAAYIVKCVNAHDQLIDAYDKMIYNYECALRLIAEATKMVYSENNFVITNKKLLETLR